MYGVGSLAWLSAQNMALGVAQGFFRPSMTSGGESQSPSSWTHQQEEVSYALHTKVLLVCALAAMCSAAHFPTVSSRHVEKPQAFLSERDLQKQFPG